MSDNILFDKKYFVDLLDPLLYKDNPLVKLTELRKLKEILKDSILLELICRPIKIYGEQK